MKIHESAENYLERILMLREAHGTVRSVDIARSLSFSKPSVSIAMKQLRENDFIEIDSDGLISLTETGQAVATRMYERHRVLSKMLEDLGVDKATALEDACRIEHVISPLSFACIKKHLEQKNMA